MTGFLTVEDVNGTIYNNQGFYWHTIDTSNITDGTENYSNVKYDFCKISRTKSGNNYNFSVTIENSYWTKGYYVSGGALASLDGNILTFNSGSVKNPIIYLYIGIIPFDSLTGIWYYIISDTVFNLKYDELGTVHKNITVKSFPDGSTKTTSRAFYEAGYTVVNTPTMPFRPIGYVLVNIVKSDFQFNCTQSLVVGKINKVYLGTDSKYKPSGSMVGSYTTNITVDYNGETLPVSYDGTDYYFNLDLTNETEAKKVKFTVNVEANEVLNKSSTDVVLKSQYQTVNTFSALLSAVSISEIIQLGANMTATSNIPINRSIKIIGNDKSIDLDGYRFVLVEDVEFKAENLQLNNGDTTIIQAKNTKVELTGVTFNNCTSSNYNGLGSCIFCDVDIDSLDNTDDYITTLTECTFTDNANCILHGGDLTIQKCTLDTDTITNINPNNCAFVYQTDGTCLIQQSIFNINYDYTSAEANIGFAQALIMCGETANINGATHTDLQTDNSLPFFDAPFNNRANLYAKYYYPQITDNVESITTVTDKGCCYSASGVDWVFKNNIQVRRVE